MNEELVDLGRRMAARTASAREVTRTRLDRIAKLDGRLHAFANVMAAGAREDAARRPGDRGGAASRAAARRAGRRQDVCWI